MNDHRASKRGFAWALTAALLTAGVTESGAALAQAGSAPKPPPPPPTAAPPAAAPPAPMPPAATPPAPMPPAPMPPAPMPAAPMPPAPTPPGATPFYPPGALPPGVSPMPGSRIPPGYGYPYYPYPYPPAMLAPREIEWEQGEPIPPGYHPATRPRMGLVIAGAVTLGSLWVLNTIPGIIGTASGDEEFAPLMIPVVGPFVGIGTLRAEGVGVALLLIDGISQAAGLAMLIAGFAAPKSILLRNDIMSKVRPGPIPLGNGRFGFGVTGAM